MAVSLSDFEWLAGFIEAEGNFHFSKANHLHVSAAQVQRWPLDRVREIVGGGVRLSKATRKNQSDCYRWEVVGSRAAGICMTLFPLLSPKRQDEIKKALSGWKSLGIRGEYRTHCLQGHPLSGDNVYIYNGGQRGCRICRSAASLRRSRKNAKWINRHPGDSQQYQCKRGHAYIEENIYWWNGKRYCKLCRKIQTDEWRQKQKAKRIEVSAVVI